MMNRFIAPAAVALTACAGATSTSPGSGNVVPVADRMSDAQIYTALGTTQEKCEASAEQAGYGRGFCGCIVHGIAEHWTVEQLASPVITEDDAVRLTDALTRILEQCTPPGGWKSADRDGS